MLSGNCGNDWTKKNLPVFYSFFARKNLFVRSFNFFDFPLDLFHFSGTNT